MLNGRQGMQPTTHPSAHSSSEKRRSIAKNLRRFAKPPKHISLPSEIIAAREMPDDPACPIAPHLWQCERDDRGGDAEPATAGISRHSSELRRAFSPV